MSIAFSKFAAGLLTFAFGVTPVSEALAASTPSVAGVQQSGNYLTLDLAMEAAAEAVHVCASHGWAVTATVVDASGAIKVEAKGDHSTPHTRDASFRKAYTQVTFGPMFGFNKLSVWVEKLKDNPFAATYATLPNIYLLPGAVGIDIKGETVAALGVGGAPGGQNDEICATAGLTKIKDRL